MEDKYRSCMFKLTALRCYNLSYVRVYTILSIASDSRNYFFCIKEGRHFVFKIYHWGVMYVCYGYRLCHIFLLYPDWIWKCPDGVVYSFPSFNIRVLFAGIYSIGNCEEFWRNYGVLFTVNFLPLIMFAVDMC